LLFANDVFGESLDTRFRVCFRLLNMFADNYNTVVCSCD